MGKRHTSAEQPGEHDVLIVGAGPVGSTLALELAHHGVTSLLVERHDAPSLHPKMDFVNGRSMELFRRLGVAEEIRARGIPARHSFNFQWFRSFAEPPVDEWTHPSVDDVFASIAERNDGTSPLEPYQRLPGNILEELLRRRAGEESLVELRTGTAFRELTQLPDGTVSATLTDMATGEEYTERARYVVGCDGASSAVRRSTAITVPIVGPETDHCDVYFRSTDPRLRPHGRYFLGISAGGATLVSRDEKDTWTAFFPVLEDTGFERDPIGVLSRRLGTDITVEEVLKVTRWRGRMGVAERYREGRVFLAGDAAHEFYPMGGHGANTGLGDAVDLGWKLAGVLKGWGGPGLLDSYEAERRPVALFNREMCFNLLEVWQRFPQLAAAGTPPSHLAGYLAQERYQIENTGIHFGYRYSSSPLVFGEDGAGETPPDWQWTGITPSTWPGGRAPSVRLPDGAPLLDRLSDGFTLVDFSGKDLGQDVTAVAGKRGMPLDVLAVDDPHARGVWERDLVLVRPDQHIAWRGEAPPADWGEVLDLVSGNGAADDTDGGPGADGGPGTGPAEGSGS
ncbi:FAD-dependent monooxygenase [Streptomyces sp. NBC_01795]|uniref:FAD-dependent monooxygenase n=1 Tax=Streptomyces sp. NBC_01795 TaxID=2975943 RepID=UPI002DD8DD0E|nr:FAD-dependent monooxygenase [Streptomyces sp. NBC_01795]WSA91203.1 FAD-dependent monooxygenase [Streptomyces sp. NBC_01795]